MDGSIKELSAYRFSKALEDLKASKLMLNESIYKASINRSYYAIFHALRAVTVLEGFDSSKHSGVISYFNQNFVKIGFLNSDASKIIKSVSRLREKSDYQDFYIASKQETEQQLENAIIFVGMIEVFLKGKNII